MRPEGPWRWAAGGVLAAAIACAGTPAKPLPGYMVNAAAADNPRYPRARYLVAVGISSASFEDAAAKAQAEIAAQISAQVQSEVASFQGFVAGSGESERVTQNISVKSAWKHAELILVVEREQRRGAYYAYAVMDRAEADQAIARDQEPEQQRFQLAVQAALDARKAGRVGDFWTAERGARGAQPAVEASWLLRRALMARPAPGEAEYRQARTALETALAEARARRVVDVVLQGAADQRLVEYAMKAVRGLGIGHVETKGCEARRAGGEQLLDATELLLAPRETCSQGSLGEKCEVQAQIVARGCASGGVGEGTVAAVKAIHPSDGDKARKAAWAKVTYQAVDAAVRDALKGAVAIGAVE